MLIVTDPPDTLHDPDNSLFRRIMEGSDEKFDPQQHEEMYRALLESAPLIPMGFPPGTPDAKELARSGKPPLPLTKVNPNTGELLLLVFTDQETMLRYEMAGFSYIFVPADKLFIRLNVEGAPELIVCAGGSHLPVSREEVRALAQGRIPPPQVTALPGKPIRRGAHISFKELDTALPNSARDTLQIALEPAAEVKAVYAFLMRQDDDPPEFSVAVIFYTFDPEAARPTMDKIAALLKPYSPPGQPLVMIPWEDGCEPAIDIGRVIPPVYQRRLI